MFDENYIHVTQVDFIYRFLISYFFLKNSP